MGRAWWWGALLLVACSGSDGGDDKDGGTDAETDGTGAGDDDDDDDVTQPIECEDTFTPCGGDAVGEWDVTGYCAVEVQGIDCDELVVTILADRSTGTVSIRSDGTYDRTFDVDADIEVAFPLTCIAPIPCALVPPASGGVIDSCIDDGTTCTCLGTVTETDVASGNWVASGTAINFDGDPWEICVTGDQAVAEDSNGARVKWER